MGFWEDLKARWDAWIGTVTGRAWAGVAETVTPPSLIAKFMDFIGEEALQTMSMGLWQLVRVKKWDAARDMLIKTAEMKDLIQNIHNMNAGWEPMSAPIWQANLDAVEAQLQAYGEIIMEEGDPAIKRKISDVYDWWNEEKVEVRARKKEELDVLRAVKSRDIDRTRDEAKMKRADIRADKKAGVITEDIATIRIAEVDRIERELIFEIKTKFAEDRKAIDVKFGKELADLLDKRGELIEDIKRGIGVPVPERIPTPPTPPPPTPPTPPPPAVPPTPPEVPPPEVPPPPKPPVPKKLRCVTYVDSWTTSERASGVPVRREGIEASYKKKFPDAYSVETTIDFDKKDYRTKVCWEE